MCPSKKKINKNKHSLKTRRFSANIITNQEQSFTRTFLSKQRDCSNHIWSHTFSRISWTKCIEYWMASLSSASHRSSLHLHGNSKRCAWKYTHPIWRVLGRFNTTKINHAWRWKRKRGRQRLPGNKKSLLRNSLPKSLAFCGIVF